MYQVKVDCGLNVNGKFEFPKRTFYTCKTKSEAKEIYRRQVERYTKDREGNGRILIVLRKMDKGKEVKRYDFLLIK